MAKRLQIIGEFPSQDSGGNVDYIGVEPAEDDIPKFFYGGALPQTKDETVMPFRYISKTQDISGYCVTKAQGTSSMNYAKKNQTTKFYKDAECTEKLKIDFRGWGKQNKFCFKANWIDITHARNVVSARLWGDVVKSRANYTDLPELLRTSPNQGAVDGFPVKVYANGVYQGRYTLNIPKDAWAYNMDDELDEHCALCSEGYGSGCFRVAANINGSDWSDEVHDTVPASIKTRWNEVISFVMNSTDEDFRSNLGNYFYVDSLIDYYLFGLAICHGDGFGKNQIYLTYDGQKWIAQAYDLDSTWGLHWHGKSFDPVDHPRTSYEDYANGTSNLLYNRLENLFWAELQARWPELKNGALSIENIINRFERFTDIAPSELIKEDYASTTGGGAFTGIPSQTTNNIQQIRAFALGRQAWTDEYVAGLTPEIPVPCESITLDKTELSFTKEESQTITATVTPNGCTDEMIWISSNPSVATISVDGAVCTVTAIANGSTTVTVTCGDYSASCSVGVSGIAVPVPCTGITLDKTELSFTEEGSQTIVATVTPADTTDKIAWVSNNTAVATVNNGVVTAVADGSCTITATCGSKSASCSVSVALPLSPVLYHNTGIDVSSAQVDTGVKLLENDIDFTIVYKATAVADNTGNAYLFNCGSSISPGNALSQKGSPVRYCFDGKDTTLVYNGGAVGVGDAITLIITHTAGSNAWNGKLRWFDKSTGVMHIGSAVESGEYVQNTGTLRLWVNTVFPTVDEFALYSYVLSDEEIDAMLDFVDTETSIDVVWSDTAKYKVSTTNGTVGSGDNYVTPDAIEILDGYDGVWLKNVNDSTFGYHSITQYDADMAFIRNITMPSNSKFAAVKFAENAKYIRFGVYPGGSNDPVNGLAAYFVTFK